MGEVEPDSVAFKPVLGGYVYRSQNPWLFGPSQHYLVSEEQKATIRLATKNRRPVLNVVYLALAMVLSSITVTILIWTASGKTLADFLLILFIGVAIVYLELCVFMQARIRRLRPILVTLTPTDQKITNKELRDRSDNATSSKSLLYLGILQAVVCGINIVLLTVNMLHGRNGADLQIYAPLFGALAFGVLAFLTFARLSRKLRDR